MAAASNTRAGGANCNPRPNKRARICKDPNSDGDLSDEDQAQIDFLMKFYGKTPLRNGVYGYFWFDPEHPYYQVGSAINAVHRNLWPPGWNAPPTHITEEIRAELVTMGKILKHMKRDVFAGTAAQGTPSTWLQTRTPPGDQVNGQVSAFQLPLGNARKVLSNYMIVRIDDIQPDVPPPDPETLEPTSHPPQRLGTYSREVECAVVATQPVESPVNWSVPCDDAPPGETLIDPEGHPAGTEQFEIPILMLWGIMPAAAPPITPPWLLTLNVARMARSGTGMVFHPPGLFRTVGEGGAWPENPFRRLVEAGQSGEYREQTVGCCYDDDVAHFSQYNNNKQECMSSPNCTYDEATKTCWQGTYNNSCADVDCGGASARVNFSHHLRKSGSNTHCCRPAAQIQSCTAKQFADCISTHHCSWDQGDGVNRPQCTARPCDVTDCGGAAVTNSVSGVAPKCKCVCKAPAVGQNFCYIPHPSYNVENCSRLLEEKCGSLRPSHMMDVEEIDACALCAEDNLPYLTGGGCSNDIINLYCGSTDEITCKNTQCPANSILVHDAGNRLKTDPLGCCVSSCAAVPCGPGTIKKPNADTIYVEDGCCELSCAGQSCEPGYQLKSDPETIGWSQGCCEEETCAVRGVFCRPGERPKDNLDTIPLSQGCCEPVTYTDKRILDDCDEMGHFTAGENQQVTCSESAMYNNGTWSNCVWDDNIGLDDCDRIESGTGANLGPVQLLQVGRLPPENARPTSGMHVWYKGLARDYNVVSACSDNCTYSAVIGDQCTDGCMKKIDQYGRVCTLNYDHNTQKWRCGPQPWTNINVASMASYNGGILSTPS